MDVLHDNGYRIWYRLGSHFEKLIPDYVLDAELPTKEAADRLPDRCYADDERRLFPVDSKVNTWLSAAYFAKNAAHSGAYTAPALRYIESRIASAANIYGISEDTSAIAQAISSDEPRVLEKVAEDDDYGWTEGSERRYPMFDANGVGRAAEYFSSNRNLYPPNMRRKLASAIMRKAAAFDVPVPDVVRREAGYGLPRRDVLAVELLDRARRTKDAEMAQAVANVNEIVIVSDMGDIGDVLEKIAEIVETLDAVEGFDSRYGKTIMAPADFIYDMDPKEAEEALSDAVQLNNHTFSAKKLAELPASTFGDALGSDFVARVTGTDGGIDNTKLADELYSLPTPDKVALENHILTCCGRMLPD